MLVKFIIHINGKFFAALEILQSSLVYKCWKNIAKRVFASQKEEHSWFATVVEGNELGPIYLFQLKQLKYEDPSDEGAVQKGSS